jgi:hypothetical protein
MRWLVIIIVACLLLTVLKAAIAVLLILLGIAVLWGVYFRPAETFGFFALLSFMSILERFPLPVLLLIGLLAVLTFVDRSNSPPVAQESQVKLLPMDSVAARPTKDDP